MGRRNASSATIENESTNTTEENIVTTPATDETVAEATTESTDAAAENTEATTTEATPTEAPAEVDLSGFTAAVENAVENRDTSTGVVAEAFIAEVNAQYRELDGVKAKAQAKKLVGEGMKQALNDMDLTKARAYMNLQEKLSAQGGGAKSAAEPKPPADPHEALAQQYAILSLAHSNVVVGEEIDRDKLNELVEKLVSEAGTKVAEYITYLTTDTPEGEDEPAEPEVEAYIKNAAKLALGRSAKAGAVKAKASGGGSTYNGPRRDVAKHIIEAFNEHDSGKFLTIAEIAKFKSSEYGDDTPSQGAISARLFPNGRESSVEGVIPDTQDGKKGARKA